MTNLKEMLAELSQCEQAFEVAQTQFEGAKVALGKAKIDLDQVSGEIEHSLAQALGGGIVATFLYLASLERQEALRELVKLQAGEEVAIPLDQTKWLLLKAQKLATGPQFSYSLEIVINPETKDGIPEGCYLGLANTAKTLAARISQYTAQEVKIAIPTKGGGR